MLSVTFIEWPESPTRCCPTWNQSPPIPFSIRVNDIGKDDRMDRRNYGLSDNQGESGSLNVNVLAGRGKTLIAIEQQPSRLRRKTNLSALKNPFYLL
jgi:hypothetical protein